MKKIRKKTIIICFIVLVALFVGAVVGRATALPKTAWVTDKDEIVIWEHKLEENMAMFDWFIESNLSVSCPSFYNASYYEFEKVSSFLDSLDDTGKQKLFDMGVLKNYEE